MLRRNFMASAAAFLGLTGTARLSGAAEGNFEVTRSKAEWKAMLTSLEYRVMREEGTERAFTSPLNDEKRAGMFHCKGCDLPLYSSEHKYDSGTGWPSFWQAQANAIGTKPDRSLFMVRTECHCRRCGSHLGHIFDDGPAPTGKRHCINGVSLSFRAA
ncbi:peptide-methionine (R)-S-oxide reductase MsrB [Marivita geojedonensis]|uniref:peptide-methionine (R)-S-oxide reductase n=1 Tax=Marivita geojedonensis TaxID=1123756 RepID=A0A1X4NMS2_9RHOB|nr:peptide-methionine (R)-S-oxide reductase MsrB [Marivita geojedonensis]OSQ51704.1 methionine sulfoxide reductase B [Marivita geojedonensis]PRY79249.1 peptide-methionine (R)-S-oxide reductase [Marivita geojedonensis]